MASDVKLGQDTFTLPDAGDNAGWGADTADWMRAINDKVDGLQGANDIALTTASVLNNQDTFAPVIGFKFTNSAVLTFNAPYLVVRTIDDTQNAPTTLTKVESGTLHGTFANGTWTLIQNDIQQDAGIVFTITNDGQIQYKTDDYQDGDNQTVNHAGLIKFQAKTTDS